MTTQPRPQPAPEPEPRPSRSLLVGWPLVGWCALAIAALEAAILIGQGTGETGLRTVIRVSARTSALLFCAAFAASALFRLYPGTTARFLLVNRRYFGVSFAVSHFSHLAAIVALAVASPQFRAGVDATTLVFGGMAYVFLAAMTATSFDRTAAWLGPRRWKRLHTVGAWYIWAIFVISYLPEGGQQITLLPTLLFALLLVAAGLRLVARRRRPPTPPAGAPS
jgi:hypothetical protein